MKKTLAIIGCDAPLEIQKELSDLGFEVRILPHDPRLADPIRSHADMLIFNIKEYIFCSAKYYSKAINIFEELTEYGYKTVKCDVELSDKYPYDIAFNMGIIEDIIWGKIEHNAKEVLKYAKSLGFELVNTNQGYAKCSTLILGNKAIITADEGISNIAKSKCKPVLKINNSPESVELPGYNYGFIGGASGVLENNIYFTGEILSHPQGRFIKEFCEELGFKTICLSSKKLLDIGGIMFFPALN